MKQQYQHTKTENSKFGENLQVFRVSEKDEKEEVEKKLPNNEYESLFIPK